MTNGTILQEYRNFRPSQFDVKGLGPARIQKMYVAPCGTNRDADVLQRANWETQNEILLAADDNCEIHSFGHWACGWFEILLIPDGSPAIAEAEKIKADLDIYPVLSDDKLSELEMEDHNNDVCGEYCPLCEERD